MLGAGGGGGGCSCSPVFAGIGTTPVPLNVPFATQSYYQQAAPPGYLAFGGGPQPARLYPQPNPSPVSALSPEWQPFLGQILKSGMQWVSNQFGEPRLLGTQATPYATNLAASQYGRIDALGGPQQVNAVLQGQAAGLQPYMSTAQYLAQQAAQAKQGGALHQADYVKLGGVAVGALAGGLLLGPAGIGLGAGLGGLAGGYLGGL